LIALVLAVLAAPAAAQTPPRQDTTKTLSERIRDRLRSIGPLIKPDTAVKDSTAARDSLKPPPGLRFPARDGAAAQAEGLTGLARDSLMAVLLQLQGYVSTEYKGNTARYEADSSRLELRGTAEVLQQGQRISADTSLVYYEKRDYACAYGNPVVTGSGVDAPVKGEQICYDIGRNTGVARGARTEVSQGALWYVRGDMFTVDDVVYSHDAIFTDCGEEHPHYHFGAEWMKVLRNNVLVAKNVTLRFGEVPVFWLPFFMQSLSRGRRSGILMPRVGINDIARNSSRYDRRIEDVGFYWAINDYLGAEVAMDWQSDNWTALRGSFDYRFLRQFFDGGLTFRRYWKTEGGRDFTLSTNNSWQPDERTRLSVTGNYTTSAEFVRQRTLDPRELNRSIDSSIGLNRRFDWGTVSLGGTRNQFLSNNTVKTGFPNLNVNLSSVTLFPALPGEARWYNNATWTASGSGRLDRSDVDDALAAPTLQDQRDFSGNVSSSFSLGKFSLSQSLQATDRFQPARAFEDDSIEDLAAVKRRATDWNTSLSYTQRLIGTSTISPSLQLNGMFLRDDSTGGTMIAGPTRMNFNASLNTDLFGFFPGLGPFEAIRHRFSPNISYGWSPEPTVDERQQRLFGVTNLREQNRITIGLSQTFEAKYKPGREPRPATNQPRSLADSLGALSDAERAALPDSLRLMADSAHARALGDSLRAAQDSSLTGPRRKETGQKIVLLSINTDALVYDFVQAKEDGQGIQTLEIGNNIQSDLLRGLQFSFGHSLFRTITPPQVPVDPTIPVDPTAPITPIVPQREFAPHLSRVNASFTLSSDSWIARFLRLSPRAPRSQADTTPRAPEPGPGMGPGIDRNQIEQGLIGGGRRQVMSAPSSPVGTWNASITYSLARPRPEERERGAFENQMVMGNLSFQPTENWAVTWNTGYSLSRGEFTDHAFTLTRRLHDFDANFDFFKAQNGNFSFQFRVQLRANPDLKLDYEQRDLPGLERIR
ncbi:MAG: putative LPS assembly protein LptD, partial [Longimicrobiales bacterium]